MINHLFSEVRISHKKRIQDKPEKCSKYRRNVFPVLADEPALTILSNSRHMLYYLNNNKKNVAGFLTRQAEEPEHKHTHG